MDVAKFRSNTAAILAALAFISVATSAEKPTVRPQTNLPKAMERPAMQGLNNPALKLTDSQRARIQIIVEGYLAEEKALSQQLAAQDAKPGKEAAAVRKQSRERMTAAVEKILDSSQRTILKEAEAAQGAALAARYAAGRAPVVESQPPAR